MLRTWLSAWLALSALGVLWVIANPIGNSPDEPSQIARAAALVRGHPVGGHVTGRAAAYTLVYVPRTYALQYNGSGAPTGGDECYRFRPTVPASCEKIVASGTTVPDVTYMGHYPLLYYAIVGLPSLVTTSDLGLYLMRVMSVLLDSAFLALAVMCSRRWSDSPVLVACVWVVTTPTAIFLNASVNASGLEIASAVAAWVAGAVLVIEQGRTRPAPGLVAVVAASSAVLALTRPISVVWVVIIVATLALTGRGRVDWQTWWASRGVRTGAVGVTVAVSLAVIWVIAAHGLDVVPSGTPPPSSPFVRLLAESVSAVGHGVIQAAGTFGWLDTGEPAVAVLALLVAVSIPAVLCLARSTTADSVAVSTLMAASLIVPVLLVLVAIQRDGTEAQGRYFMPLWVGLPLLASALQRPLPHRFAKRLTRVMVILPAGGMVIAFWWNLHRVSVGIGGPYFPWDSIPKKWNPPVPSTLLVLMCLVTVSALAALFLRFSPPAPMPTAASDRAGAD